MVDCPPSRGSPHPSAATDGRLSEDFDSRTETPGGVGAASRPISVRIPPSIRNGASPLRGFRAVR
jgi:hypothetical protein